MLTAYLPVAIRLLSYATIVYFVVWRGTQMVAGTVAGWLIFRDLRRRTTRNLALPRHLSSRPLVSVIVPAYNEGLTIIESIRSIQALDYPRREIVIVNDGSSDDTLARLQDHFQLLPAPIALAPELETEPIRGIYRSVVATELIVVDKQNGGSKADALNGGLKVASGELVLVVDADTVLAPEALSRAILPFLEHPETVAVGGHVAVINGCRLDQGRVVEAGLPRSWLARFQVVEYMRSFLLVRVAHASMNALMIISGAFGLFRRDAVIAVGGFDRTAVGEDMDLTVRLQAFRREQGRPFRIVFDPFLLCSTQVPEDWASLRVQRTRWRRGLLQTLWRHRRMIGNPRFGALGMFVMPFVTIFEGAAPLIGAGGYVIFTAATLGGVLNWRNYGLLILVGLLFSISANLLAVLLSDMATGRYQRSADLLVLVLSAVAERLGFRQFNAWCGLLGTVQAITGKGDWGVMSRRVFKSDRPVKTP
jgi:cellulose synthase/poly-beta-1,6-N-acetylglucosamine synthase-like glycosyltransferase